MLEEVEMLIIQGLKELFKKEIDAPQLQIIHDIYRDIRGAQAGRDEKEYLSLDDRKPAI